ncbi:DUF2399 domain-containing protein [Saccharopolyspora spinosa]|uniref:DUF2399 domain-containing protein n=1 Tax=Saccharopolyspora spinosa TaxID=60894 RepID=UPI0003092EE3|nr:DUF2399 domain-containing protein [Saccharopolyspora spinosa]
MSDDLTDPDIAPLWKAIAERLAQGHDPACIQQVTPRLSRAGRAMLISWLTHTTQKARRRKIRLHTRDNRTIVPVPALLQALRVTPHDLPLLVKQATGGYPDLAGQRRNAALLRDDIWAHATALLADTPRLLARLRAAGVSDDKADELRKLIDALGRARHLLPLPRPVPLARLSLACAGNPHYFDLDDTRNGAKLVLLAADLLEVPLPDTPAADRAALARVGVIADRLSQTVLTFNINATGNGPTDRALRLAQIDRRPVHVTLHDLIAYPPTFSTAAWLVVENTSVVEEAFTRGVMCPIVCTAGTLTAVDHVLLGLARDQQVMMRYSGDLDHAGITIADTVRNRYGAQPWHMDAETLHTATHSGPLTNQPPAVPELNGPSLVPLPPETPSTTDPQSIASADRPRWVVFQEHPVVLDRLLGPDPDDPFELPKNA